MSRDIKYYTALLYFFRPYIIDVRSGIYFQTIEDRRYMMYASVAYQTIYNFWDRIGDLLNLYFNTGLADTSVYYSRVLHNFPKEYKASPNYEWLNEILNSEVRGFLGERDHVVHSYQLECEYYWKAIEWFKDPSKLQQIQNEREAFPEKFKRQIELTREAFARALRLINELPDK